MSLTSPSKAQKIIAQSVRERRLLLDLTQEGLSVRSGVPLATLRKFEQQGVISLESLLKIAMVLGMLDALIKAVEVPKDAYTSLDEIIKSDSKPKRKRGKNS
ncbi:MAG: XRE family transcriptional regulator [Spirochaetia bacterium]|nr:XRE family transcriptional regulator [Spirochaetia bacterium]